MFLSNKYEAASDGERTSTKTIFIAEDDLDIAQMLTLRLQKLGFSIVKTSDAAHALVGIKKTCPDLVILDINMPGGNGLAVCEMLSCDQACNTIPVIIHTACASKLTITRCKYLGAHYVLKSSGSWRQIQDIICQELNLDPEQTISSLQEKKEIHALPPFDSSPTKGRTNQPSNQLQASSADRPCLETIDTRGIARTNQQEIPTQQINEPKVPKVLCIDDDLEILEILRMKLEGFGIEVLCASCGDEGISIALEQKPDVIVSDMILPEGEGTYIFRRLQSDPATQDIPVIILSGQGYPAIRQQMASLGVAAFLTKPLSVNQLLPALRLHIDFPKTPLASNADSLVTS